MESRREFDDHRIASERYDTADGPHNSFVISGYFPVRSGKLREVPS